VALHLNYEPRQEKRTPEGLILLPETASYSHHPRPLNESKIDKLQAETHAYLVEHLGQYDAARVFHAGQRITNLIDRTAYYAHVVLQIEREVLGNQVIEGLCVNL
jgi:hypothetical protein